MMEAVSATLVTRQHVRPCGHCAKGEGRHSHTRAQTHAHAQQCARPSTPPARTSSAAESFCTATVRLLPVSVFALPEL
jgi:hypothetical protein